MAAWLKRKNNNNNTIIKRRSICPEEKVHMEVKKVDHQKLR